MCLNSARAAENSSSVALMCQAHEPPTSKNNRTFIASKPLGAHENIEVALMSAALIVPGRSSSSSAPVRANLRSRTRNL